MEDAATSPESEHGSERALREREAAISEASDNAVTDKAPPKGRAKPQSKKLIELARMDAEFWRSPEREAFATVEIGGARINCSVGSKIFKHWLTRKYDQTFGGAPARQAFSEAIGTIEAGAALGDVEHEPALRVARYRDAVFIDLGDPSWRAVKITPKGWTIVRKVPVKFLRPRGFRSLPEPDRQGSIKELRPFVNVETEGDFRMIVAWLINALHPSKTYPILELNGEHGSAKSSTARVLRQLVDPNAAPVRQKPRDDRDLAAAAINNWVVAIDNLSSISADRADSLARLATGVGVGGRELYKDLDELIIHTARPILLNGISRLTQRSDLADRSVVITLPSIRDEHRRTEAEFWAAFERARPLILGALFNAVSCALRRFDDVNLAEMPRMADFARFVTAAEPALGWREDSFMSAYKKNRARAMETIVDADPIAQGVIEIASGEGFRGTATELLKELTVGRGEEIRRDRSWPNSPSALSGRLNRLVPTLRAFGVSMEVRRDPEKRHKIWTIASIPEFSSDADIDAN